MPVRPTWSPQALPYLPRFANGTTGGPSGTVSDGGQAGRVTFTLPASGHTDPSDGCWIAWPARDVLGRLMSGLGDPIDYLRTPHGLAYGDVVTAPASDKGVRLWVGVIAAPTAADVDGTDGHGFGGELEMTSPREINALIISSGGWTQVGGPSLPAAQDDRYGVSGDLLQTAVSVAYDPVTGRMDQSRFAGNEQVTDPTDAGKDLWLVAGAYRTGSSTGSASATVDVAAYLLQLSR